MATTPPPQQWFWKLNGQIRGPIAARELRAMASAGTLAPDSLIRRSDKADWIVASTVIGLFQKSPPQATTPPQPIMPLAPAVGPAVELSRPGEVSSSRRPSARTVIGVGLILAIVAVVALICLQPNQSTEQPVVMAPTAQPTPPPATQPKLSAPVENIAGERGRENPSNDEIRKIAALVAPSVVTITTAEGLGSGFLVDAAGTVATNFHVIDRATSATVVFSDGRTARVSGFVAVSPGKDLAILRLEPTGGTHKALPLASQQPAQGDKVFLLGSPNGLDASLADGIVSAVRRGLPEYDADATWIQTTAAMSHDISGGPLFNIKGEVVGVNTFGLKDGNNLNFAISASHVRELLNNAQNRERPLAELPPSRRAKQLADAEEAKQRALAEASRKDADARQGQKDATAKEKRQREAQYELDRLAAQLTKVQSEIASIESDLAAQTAKRDAAKAEAADVETSGKRVNAQGQDVERQLVQITKSISAAQSNPNTATGGQMQAMQARRNALLAQHDALAQQAAALNTKFATLDSEVKDLASQVAAKAAERTAKLGMQRYIQLRQQQVSSSGSAADVAIPRTPTKQGIVISVGYDETWKVLAVELKGGAVTEFFDVPPEMYKGLMGAASKPNYFKARVQKAAYLSIQK